MAMVTRRGACDFTLFSVNPGAVAFHTVGTLPDNTRHIEHRIEKSNAAALLRSEADGAIWGWSYESEDVSPEIWVVRDVATGAALYVHESENQIASGISPLISEQVDRDGISQSIIPAGSETKQILIPMDTVITDLETEIEAAALPSWVSGTTWEWAPDCETLLAFLFQEEQRLRGLPIYTTIDAVYSVEMPVDQTALYTLLWLRCASSILYDHENRETCIPLVKARFTVDSNGLITPRATQASLNPNTEFAFTGSGLNDVTVSGTYTGTTHRHYKLLVDSKIEEKPDAAEIMKLYIDGVEDSEINLFETGVPYGVEDSGVTFTIPTDNTHTIGNYWETEVFELNK